MAICSETFGNFLANEYGVIISVLKNLPCKDLFRKACVCKSWSQAARQILKERQKPEWFIWTVTQPSGCHDGDHGSNNTTDLPRFLENFFEETFCDPAFCIVFASSTCKPNHICEEQSSHNKKRKGLTAMTLIKDAFSKYCQTYGLIAPGVIGSSWRSTQVSEEEDKPSIAALFLPKLPSVEIYQFVLNDETLFRPIDEDMVHHLTHVPKDSEVKALLLFTNHNQNNYLLSSILANFYCRKQDNNIAIGGGIGDRILAPSIKNWRAPTTLGVAFVGENIRAASTVIRKGISSLNVIENMLMKLREADLFPNKIAFMFACVGRGFNFYRKHNVESEVFHKVFPDVPLLGFFGDGEIGVECIPKTTTACGGPQTKKSKLDLFHSYSTVFVIISFKTN